VSQYADDGFLPDAMFNYLTLLGWSSPDGVEVFSREHAAELFALDRVNAAPAVFDHQKLEWLNGQYIHAMSAAELRPLVAPFFDAPWLEEGIDVVKTSVHLLTQFGDALRFVREYAAPQIDRPFAEALSNELRTNGTPVDETSFKAMVERLKTATGLKGKTLFMPLRLALTGSDHGPELVRAIPLLERASKLDSSVLSPLQRAEQCIR
jgi:nondiscriminating glutamyl-tRNA synthetase